MKKTCKGCEKELPLEDFHRNKVAKDGRQTQCKACMNFRRRTNGNIADAMSHPEIDALLRRAWR